MLGLTSVTLRMCMEVVWIRLCTSPVHSLEGGSGPAFLGGRVLGQGRSMIFRCPWICLHCR